MAETSFPVQAAVSVSPSVLNNAGVAPPMHKRADDQFALVAALAAGAAGAGLTDRTDRRRTVLAGGAVLAGGTGRTRRA